MLKTNYSITKECVYMDVAAAELAKAAENLIFGKNTLGILYCDSGLDIPNLMRELKKLLPFDIVGSLTQAVLSNETGMNEFSSMLTVMTSDDVFFNTYVSKPITASSIKDKIEELCCEAKEVLDSGVKMIYCQTPFIPGVLIDDYPECFNKFAGNIPLFGGFSAYDIKDSFSAAMYNENVYYDCMVITFFSGNIRPVFAISSNIKEDKNRQLVTHSEENVLYRVSDMTFLDYINSLGLALDVPEEYAMDFLLASITVNVIIDDEIGNDGIGVYRAAYDIDREKGSASFYGRVPQGSYVAAISYRMEDVETSAIDCVNTLLKRMEEEKTDDYTYTTVLCGSCNGRYMFMFPTKDTEGGVVMDLVPKELLFAGYYTYGEMCPTSVRDGIPVNRGHSTTLIMCAL